LRTRKITLLVLVSLLVIGISACNIGDNDRPLTRGYNSPDGLAPYTTYDYDNRDGMIYNRYDRGRMRNADDTNNGMIYNRNDRGRLTRNTDDTNNRNGYLNNRNLGNVNAEAERIADAAAQVKGVDDATVVIAGGTAYVALDLTDRVQTREAANVERAVYNKLKQYANRYNLSITSDADLFGRLRDIGDGVRGGTPVNNYQTDLRDFDTRFNNYRTR